MIEQKEALRLVLESVPVSGSESIALSKSLGRALAEDVHSDIDMPPFDRSAMDGYAIAGDGLEHMIIGEIAAGRASEEDEVSPGQAMAIMTGAPVPRGADRVVMIEHTTREGDELTLSRAPRSGRNICWRGEDIRSGQRVLDRGLRLGPHHLGIAAMAGRAALEVHRKPRIGLLTTGSEVIPPSSIPLPGQVRNANLILMEGIVTASGFEPSYMAHARDDRQSLSSALGQLIECSDAIAVAGGVSKGAYDYVPGVLSELGVEFLFRAVAQKPGKPFAYGLTNDRKPVFGLPGNPVSVLVCMEEYVICALRRMSGLAACRKRDFRGRLESSVEKKRGRMGFLRTEATLSDGDWLLGLPQTSGSGDLMSTVDTNSLALVDSSVQALEEGSEVRFHLHAFEGGEAAFTC